MGTEELNLFSLPQFDGSIISRQDTDYYPSNASPGNTKETIIINVINQSDVDFIDLSSTEILLQLRVKKKSDNSNLASTMKAAKYGICNNFGHSIFKQITLQEGDIDMNLSTGTYPYQVDFENVITYDERDLEGRPRIEGNIPDTMSATSLAKLFPNDNTNAGLLARSSLFDNSQLVHCIIKPHLGPIAQPRYILPETRVQFKMILHSDDFIFTADATATDVYGLYIENIKLRVRTVKINQQAAMAIRRTLQKRRTVYPTPVPYLTTHIIDNGVFNWEKDNVFNDKIPKVLMFGIVKNDAYNGHLEKTHSIFVI